MTSFCTKCGVKPSVTGWLLCGHAQRDIFAEVIEDAKMKIHGESSMHVGARLKKEEPHSERVGHVDDHIKDDYVNSR
jgi:hypothetical protein